MKQKSFDEFTNLYPVQKTLRFELKPVGKTKDWIEKNGLLEQDNHRAESYKVVKKVIDHYHKHFIDQGLRKLQGELKEKFNSGLRSYMSLKNTSGEKRGETNSSKKKNLEKEQDSLRKIISGLFNIKQLSYPTLIKEDLINYLLECERNGEKLPTQFSVSECKSLIQEFDEFTTYFDGYKKNRENMYSSDAKATAIAFRLIHENLPKFVANMEVWKKVNIVLKAQMTQLEKEMDFELGGKNLASFFEDITSYADCLTQSNITRYNAIIGGRSEGDTKVQGINEYINLYNQKAAKKDRLPKMTELYKMILSDRESVSWLPDNFSNDNELLEKVNEAYLQIHEQVFEGDSEHLSLKNLISNLSDFNLSGIYIKNDTTLTTVVKQAYGDWAEMSKGLANAYNSTNPQGKKSDEKYSEARKKWMDSFDSFSIDDICYYTGKDNVVSWYEGLWSQDEKTAFERAEEAYTDTKDLLNTTYHGNLKADSNSIEHLKMLLDALKDIQRLANTLKGNGDESGRDGAFYAEWDRLVEILNQVTPLYNMVRNYVTQKAYSEEKIKLNFENPVLLNGWDLNKETTNLGILLKKNGLYYLAIINAHDRKVLSGTSIPQDGVCYEKMEYKQIALPMGFGAFVRKCYGTARSLGWNCPDECLNEEGKIIIKDDEADGKLVQLIDCYKDFLNIYEKDGFRYQSFNFKFKRSADYEKLSHFFAEVPNQGYKLSFRPVAESYIDSLVEQGKLYLFQIYNKDFSSYSKGTPNMHTLYWRALFSDENLKDVIYKLNGQAEVFYRKHSIKYNEKQWNEGHHHEMLKDKFSYPIIKDRRYALDKFQFHVPITMNFKADGRESINQQVCEFIKAGGVEHIIGIDRGERHLLYLSMIDLNGNIVKQFSLNTVKNEYKETNYHALLDKKEEDREKARKNWQTIEGIKDLKEGYMSQVVHIISQLMVEYKAIVVLEDLNFGFMRGRQKVEKQVYQKFEKALIDKLNYLVDKKKPINETGGILHALQLTSKFESFQKLGKQSGFLFYVPASLTSKIDPVTGFANYINTKYENREKAVELLGKFANIRYNAEKDYFEFLIDDYTKFNPKAIGRQQWTVCSYGSRIKTFRNPKKNNEWDNKEFDLTKALKHLFDTFGIDYRVNLIAQILIQNDKKFFSNVEGWANGQGCLGILDLLGLILQMRNSITGTETDYIISPVTDEEGNFYCSNNGNEQLPKDADANGAYNIARKGLWAVMQMQQADDPAKVSLAMSNDEWMRFAQEKPYKK